MGANNGFQRRKTRRREKTSYEPRRRFRTGGFGFGPKPVEVGKEYDVTVSETSRRGDGVAKIGGFIIFIPSTSPGQKVRVKVTRVAPRFAVAEVVGPLTSGSPQE